MQRRLANKRLSASLLAVAMVLRLSIPGFAATKPSAYLYEDTRQLVALVEDAATLMERTGRDAFKEFCRKGSPWLDDQHYFFVYDLDGIWCAIRSNRNWWART